MGRNKDLPLLDCGSDSELANRFNIFFIAKITKIREDLGQQEDFISNNQFNDKDKMEVSEELTQLEVEDIVKNSKFTTFGTDPMPSKLIKQHLDVPLPMIPRMVNHSLMAGVFNENWKTSIVNPLLKKDGLDRVLKNYRPVNNLTYMSKIIEKAMLFRFNDHCRRNNLMPDYVSTYRLGYSTETVLLRLADEILQNMDRQCITPLVAVNLSTAFDTVEQ